MKRIVGCFSNCFGADGVRTAVERLRSTGLSTIELALRGHDFGGLVIPESAVITVDSSEAEVKGLRALMAREGVAASGCNVGGANILTEEGLRLTLRRVELAGKRFGVPLVITGAGQPKDAGERRVMVDHLRILGDAAGALGMVLALETHQGPTRNARAMLELMSEVDHPSVGLNFDTGNIAYYNPGMDPVDELEKVKKLVRNVHLKDNRGGFEDWYFPAVGDGGSVNFRRVREILDGVGFVGPYTIEIEGIGGESEPGLEGRVERLSRSVKHLEKAGYFD